MKMPKLIEQDTGIGLAGLLLAAWIGLTVKTRKRIRRPQHDDEGAE
jgi:hypothetical protein